VELIPVVREEVDLLQNLLREIHDAFMYYPRCIGMLKIHAENFHGQIKFDKA
jgi:hypothetical protein